jgi:hypothetical protein
MNGFKKWSSLRRMRAKEFGASQSIEKTREPKTMLVLEQCLCQKRGE